MKQRKFDDKANPELNAYIGLCYQWLAMWPEAERFFRKQYDADSLNVSNRNYLANFYTKYAVWAGKQKDYATAYQCHIQSYGRFKRNYSLFSAIKASLKLKQPQEVLEKLIDRGIRDSVFEASSIYMDLATECRNEVDSVKNYIPYYLQKAVIFLKKHIRDNESSGAYSLLGSTYFRLNYLDSAEHYYSLALDRNRAEPMHYFNLAELQTIMLKPAIALATLEEVNTKFIQSSGYPVDLDYLKALYYFYSMENKAVKGADFDADKKALLNLMERYKDGSALFSTWSFRTFYNWATNGQNLPLDKRNIILENLCLIHDYSKDVGVACEKGS